MSDKPEWTPDCQGKWDYDGPLVRVSSRYWPRGGGFSVLRNGEFVTNENQDIRPSAHSTIVIGADEVWAEHEFEGDTEAQVKAEVERWVAEQFAVIKDRLAPTPAEGATS